MNALPTASRILLVLLAAVLLTVAVFDAWRLQYLLALGEVNIFQAAFLPWHFPAMSMRLGIGLGALGLLWDGLRTRRFLGFALIALFLGMGLNLAGQIPYTLGIPMPPPLRFVERQWLSAQVVQHALTTLAYAQVTLHVQLRGRGEHPGRLTGLASLTTAVGLALLFPVFQELTYGSLAYVADAIRRAPVAYPLQALIRPMAVPVALGALALFLPRRTVRDGIAFGLLGFTLLDFALAMILAPDPYSWYWTVSGFFPRPLDLVLAFMLLEWQFGRHPARTASNP